MLRLMALLVVPLAGFAFLAVKRIGDQNATASLARHSADDAELQRLVSAVEGPAHLEELVLVGLAEIDALDLDRDLVASFIGLDLESAGADQSARFDAAIADLEAEYGTLGIATSTSSSTVTDELRTIRDEIATHRTERDRLSGDPVATTETFERLEDLLQQVLASGLNDAPDTGDALAQRWKLGALNEVLHADGHRGLAIVDSVFHRSPESSIGAIGAAISFDEAVERFESMLDDDERPEFDALMSNLSPLPEVLVGPDAVTESVDVADVEYIQAAADAVIEQLAFQVEVERYSEAFHAAVVDDLRERADVAANDARVTTIAFGVVALASLILLLLIGWSTLRPVRRLTRHAKAIGEGAFDTPPLPLAGPADVRILTSTMNDMLTTLHDVDSQIRMLADGDEPDHEIALPGSVGVSLRRSFERLQQTTTRLHASEQLSSAIVEQAADAIWTVDEHGIIRSANDASEFLLGLRRDEQIGRRLTDYVPSLRGAVAVRSADGVTTRVLVSHSEIDAGDEVLAAVIAHDIDERARYEEQLAHQATHDALTGLPNRLALLERLERAPAHEPLGVLFIDLDGFKSINDTQGHVAGDAVLTEVARRLVTRVRPSDFVARLGGDEFVVVVDDADADGLLGFGSRLIHELESPHGDGDELFMVSASIGVATFPGGLASQQLSPLDAIRYADSAVYEAKRHGRGRVELFDADLQASVIHDAEVEIALRSAIRNDELVLHLQPLVDLATGEFDGAEALVRWNRPGRGMVPPGEFIAVAERSSLIIDIQRWVLTTVCETAAWWRELDPSTSHRISINIAGSHLSEGNLVLDLDRALAETGADPAMLEFELTETQVMGDIERATAVLAAVRERGVSVAIDDFGTGYSSMAYLRLLPIDTLKIDGSFVAGLDEEGFDATVLDALLTIGESLGLSVVAEGIENEAQLEHVRSRGCARAQGFHLARPQPIDDVERLLVHDVSERVPGTV